MTQLALRCRSSELLRTEVRALGPDSWRVRMAVATAAGCRLTSASARCSARVVRGVVFEITLPQGDPAIALVSGKGASEGPQLAEGHAPKQSQIAFLPSREVTADHAVAEWVVQKQAQRASR